MLEVEGIYKAYGKRKVLQGVSFAAEPGECIGIVGGNGCGKTTLLSILAGVNRPDRGAVRFSGANAVGKRSIFERSAAYVPQENPLIPELSAADNYRLWFRGNKKAMEEDLKHGVGHVLGIREFLGTRADRLSGGQKKRLSIASALSNRASVLIMDEPGAALDLAAKQEILSYIKSFVAQGGIVILTSHEMAELSVCTSLYVLKDGMMKPMEKGLSADAMINRF